MKRNYDQICLTYLDPEEVVEVINEAWTKYGKENVYTDYDFGEYQDSSPRFFLRCAREETQAERERREADEKRSKEERRRYYEALKKEFEND